MNIHLKRKNAVLLNALVLSRTISIVTFFAMLGCVWVSFLAEPFEQEVGYGTSILGYNRDLFVNGRWWFAAAAALCLLCALSSSIRISAGGELPGEGGDR